MKKNNSIVKKTIDNIFNDKKNKNNYKITYDIDYIYKINHNRDPDLKLSQTDLKNTNNTLNKFYESYKKYDEKKHSNKNISYIQTKSKFFSSDKIIKYLFKIISSNENFDNVEIDDNKDDKNKTNNNKFENIFLRYKPDFYLKKIKNISKKEQNHNIYIAVIHTLLNLNKILKDNGNMIFFIRGFNGYMIELIFLMSYIFDEVIIVDGYIIICKKYMNNMREDIQKIINNNYKFNIESINEKDINNLYKYFKNIYGTELKIKKKYLLNTKNESEYIKYKYFKYVNLAKQLGLDYLPEVQIDLDLIFANNFRIKYNENKDYKITSAINFTEGNYIEKIINKYNFKDCLEIGMANGLSSIFILKNNNTNLTSIDPYQTEQWKKEGVKFLKKLKIDKNHDLIEKKSYEALPELLSKGIKYDFIFIDGWHTFDYTLIDFFYSDLLLKIGGIIIIDDALHSGVSKCCKYIDTNYKFYKKLESPNSVAAYLKISEDKREWNFHENF